MKPICIPCQRFFKPDKNGFTFLEGMPAEKGAKPGTSEPEKWKPYKLWVGDAWVCHGCGARIIVGVGRDRIAAYPQQEPEPMTDADYCAGYGHAEFQESGRCYCGERRYEH